MPNGAEYVEATLAKIEGISAAIGGLAGAEDEWKTNAQGRLDALAELLRGMGDRFFLKTRVCLPFARKCDQAAEGLESLVSEALASERGGHEVPTSRYASSAFSAYSSSTVSARCWRCSS